MKLKDLNEMMLNPMSILKCKKLKKRMEVLSNAGGNMQGDVEGMKSLNDEISTNKAEQEKLGCK